MRTALVAAILLSGVCESHAASGGDWRWSPTGLTGRCYLMLQRADSPTNQPIEYLFGKRLSDLTLDGFKEVTSLTASCRKIVTTGIFGDVAPRLKLIAKVLRELLSKQCADRAQPDVNEQDRQLIEECQRLYRDEIAVIGAEVHLVRTTEPSRMRFDDVKSRYELLVKSIPSGVRPSLREIEDNLATDFQVSNAIISQIDDERHRAGELRAMYAMYMRLQVCPGKFPQFKSAVSELKAVLKEREKHFSRDQIELLWSVVAERFQRIESFLEKDKDDRLLEECDHVFDLMLFVPEVRELRKNAATKRKDF